MEKTAASESNTRRIALWGAAAMLCTAIALAGCAPAQNQAADADGTASESAAANGSAELVIADAFPDAGVAAAVSEQLDSDGNGSLSEGEVQAAVQLSVQDAAEVSGLGEALPQLAALTVSGSTATVDASGMPALTSLDVSGSSVKKLDTSGDAQLATLDVSGCSSLQVVNLAGDAAIQALDFSSCGNLRGVDVTGCAGLSSVEAGDEAVFNGVGDTQVEERWLVKKFTWHRPGYQVIADEDITAKATYDEGSRLVKLEVDESGLAGNRTWSLAYDQNGALETATLSAPTVNDAIYMAERDAEGRLTAFAQDVSEPELLRYNFQYDDAGRLTEAPQVVVAYNDNGQVASIASGEGKAVLSYKDGLLTAAEGVNDEGSLTADIDTSYGADGKPEAVTTVFATSGTGVQSFCYGPGGALVDVSRERKAGNRGTQLVCPNVSSTKFTYDDHGNLVKWVAAFTEDGEAKAKGTISYQRVFLPKDASVPRQDFLFAADPLNPRIVEFFYSPDAALDAQMLAYTNGVPDSSLWIPRAQPADVSQMQVEEGAASEPAKSADADGAANADYVLSESADRKYDAAELEAMSDRELFLARNEIFARHGRIFKSAELVEYFGGKSWYKGTVEPEEFDRAMEGILSDIERANVNAILAIEKDRGSKYLS